EPAFPGPGSVFLAQDDTAAGRDHGLRPVGEIGEDGRFFVAEARFAPGGEDVADRLAVAFFEYLVGIDELPPQPAGQDAADGRFPGPAIADEKDQRGHTRLRSRFELDRP